jgi:hypothetical protein
LATAIGCCLFLDPNECGEWKRIFSFPFQLSPALFSFSFLSSIFFPFQDFMVFADRLMRLLAEEALCRLPSITDDGIVETPIGTARKGLVRTDSGANMIQLLKISFRNAKFAVLTT